jgi:hypothetical protein
VKKSRSQRFGYLTLEEYLFHRQHQKLFVYQLKNPEEMVKKMGQTSKLTSTLE